MPRTTRKIKITAVPTSCSDEETIAALVELIPILQKAATRRDAERATAEHNRPVSASPRTNE